ncbi:MAG: SRPBCC domain-containing protein [Armatimonadetes bacterium]|nr:SRPBCC domain-containing protein [Armatimonadota bacterium]
MPHLATEFVNDSTVRLTYSLAAPVARVFGMWADSRLFESWFCPGEPWECSLPAYDFRPGGAYRVHMLAPDKDVYELFGEFQTIEHEQSIVFSWNWEDSPTHPEPSLVDIRLEPSAAGTKMVLTHSRFLSELSRGRHEEGWGHCIGRLEKALETD